MKTKKRFMINRDTDHKHRTYEQGYATGLKVGRKDKPEPYASGIIDAAEENYLKSVGSNATSQWKGGFYDGYKKGFDEKFKNPFSEFSLAKFKRFKKFLSKQFGGGGVKKFMHPTKKFGARDKFQAGWDAGVEFAREEDHPSWTKAWNEYFAKVIPNSQSTGSTEFKRGFARGFTKENRALRGDHDDFDRSGAGYNQASQGRTKSFSVYDNAWENGVLEGRRYARETGLTYPEAWARYQREVSGGEHRLKTAFVKGWKAGFAEYRPPSQMSQGPTKKFATKLPSGNIEYWSRPSSLGGAPEQWYFHFIKSENLKGVFGPYGSKNEMFVAAREIQKQGYSKWGGHETPFSEDFGLSSVVPVGDLKKIGGGGPIGGGTVSGRKRRLDRTNEIAEDEWIAELERKGSMRRENTPPYGKEPDFSDFSDSKLRRFAKFARKQLRSGPQDWRDSGDEEWTNEDYWGDDLPDDDDN